MRPVVRRAACGILMGLQIFMAGPAGAGKPAPRPPAQGSFTDQLHFFDSARWAEADGWTNGSPFDNAWGADHIGFHDLLMDLRLDDTSAPK
jgi:beta-glucanase (GH16 family)